MHVKLIEGRREQDGSLPISRHRAARFTHQPRVFKHSNGNWDKSDQSHEGKLSVCITFYLASPCILLGVLKALGNESKVLANLQPQIRMWHPAIVSMDGMVLGQLPGYKPTRKYRGNVGV